MTNIQVHERDGWLILRTSHSALEFNMVEVEGGFRLVRGARLLFASGPKWGAPNTRFAQYHQEAERVIVTFHRGKNGLGRLSVSALIDGWDLSWDQPTRDTFSIEAGGYWYGQGEIVNQLYPLNKMSQWEAPFLTWDNGPTGVGNIVTPLWLTSTGVALLVDGHSDAFLTGFNAPPKSVPVPRWSLDFGDMAPVDQRPPLAMEDGSGVLAISDPKGPLRYTLMVGVDTPAAYQRATRRLGRPANIPPENLLRQPIWTTWARFKMAISQEIVVHFGEEIRQHHFPGGTLEIDDRWQEYYGDTWFEPARFPDPAGMVKKLNDMGFEVTMWIIPFLDPQSPNAKYAASQKYVVMNNDGEPYLVRWWQGHGYLLDMTNPGAVQWWGKMLNQLKDSCGLAGFKFDAGEGNYLPEDAVTYQPINRNEYSTRWVSFGAENFPYCEARCGWNCQKHSILFRHWDKFSTWGYDNGLASVITTALSLSLIGYPFTLPDMIGGNAYAGVEADKELMIRWTQASAPMLSIQFSLVPWAYDQETINICRKYAELHVALADERVGLAHRVVETGDPIIAPLFWASPQDVETYTIADQYMLGDKYMVAPVVQQGAVSRDIYLPIGQWRDYWTGEVYTGGRWLYEFPAPLEVLPLFVRDIS
jgi:myogenesis-regulating glycosidase